MSNKFTYDVFLCHSSLDKPRVRRLDERLRKAGLAVWLDERNTVVGEDINLSIERGLEVSRTLILCMTPWAFGSDWVRLERSTAMFRDPTGKSRRFIPLLMVDCEMPDTIRRLKYVDYREESDIAFAQLESACSSDPAENSALVTGPSNGMRISEPAALDTSILPLHVAEDRYLQILLSNFSISRRRSSTTSSFELSINFDHTTPAIWSQEGKRYLRSILSKDMRKRYQRSLDDFLLKGLGTSDFYHFDNPIFFFRYASGGTLPIITFTEGKIAGDYFCLFYREIHPIGWNIANGGSDSRAELLNPQAIIERELREELIIADFERYNRYAFRKDAEKPLNDPAHEVARRLWTQRFPSLSGLDVVKVPIEWQPGPDSLLVKVGNDKSIKRQGFFLNVNGEDFGIEFDKVAKIRLPGTITLFDGEMDGGALLNCPVGLFNVERFSRQLRKVGPKEQSYKPDFFFFNAERYDGSKIDHIIKNEFMKQVREFRTEEEIREFKEHIDEGEQYGLCPVTERIAARFLHTVGLQT
jgi:hypothetical protein